MELHVGLDVGSTTVKVVALDAGRQLLFKSYERHFSDIRGTVLNRLRELAGRFPGARLKMSASGSSGMGLSERLGIPFVQEVVACTEAVRRAGPAVDVIIELGGEDAKLIYLTGGLEQRMNTACAGGTGAFIDQIAALLGTDAAGLNELAKKAEKIYPIASRCGVFAKTDIQPLINEGARREDIAASVFQAVVNQTIGGLACGRPIRGNVAFLGGPLTFLSELRRRFIETLGLAEEQILFSEDGHYYVAIGAALESGRCADVDLKSVLAALDGPGAVVASSASGRHAPLFAGEAELDAFRARHARAKVPERALADYRGSAFLGIDAGSTTTKMVLIGEGGEVLYHFYDNNRGNPLEKVREGLARLYAQLPAGVTIARSAVTGYGEKLVQAAFRVDEGEVETVAHCRAARQFVPDVDFILDIGGQDMKGIRIKNGAVDRIILNEACSAGCGSFLESFAATLGLSAREFADLALAAKAPVQLGSRCTVFMNSRVKQVQKEGAGIADIAAGLACSVVQNALYKVLKIRSADELGQHIVVQGGTFLNDAVLRAFELGIGREVVRPNLAGLMGAYGAALIARDRFGGQPTTLLAAEALHDFRTDVRYGRCGLCENNCPLTIIRFPDKRTFITGNRCERGAGKPNAAGGLPNLAREKLDKLFKREVLSPETAPRGAIGLPRALNMYENYPLWHRFFTELGFAVVLSDPSGKAMHEKAMDTIPSDTVCYPAKLVHGHILNLVEKGVPAIFYPAVMYERKESGSQQNHYNCPIVAYYPEVIRVNMKAVLEARGVRFFAPFLNLNDEGALEKALRETFSGIPAKEIRRALRAGMREQEEYHAWLRKRAEDILAELVPTGGKAIVMAGHPYHIDPAVNHGLPEEMNRLGFAVLTEDAAACLADDRPPVGVVNQWTYHSRLYRAAGAVKKYRQLELVQVSSFGCGLDAITTDATAEMLEEAGELYTWIKMDEISNAGAARIRLRSLKAAVRERERGGDADRWREALKRNEPVFGKEDRAIRTILAPQMLPTHFELFEKAFRLGGYRLKVLKEVTASDVAAGLRYVNNDACYPAILTIGQLVGALLGGGYDPDRTAVIMSQTGGGCRATNYLALLKKALRNAGLPQVPVLSLSAAHLGGVRHPGFRITPPVAKSLVVAACLGDLLMRLVLAVRPYEKVKGTADRLHRAWLDRCKALLEHFSMKAYRQTIRAIVDDFGRVDVVPEKKPRVGIVGEILVKFHPQANNRLVDVIEREGGEAVVPDFIDFFLYGLHNRKFKAEHFGFSPWHQAAGKLAIAAIEFFREPVRQALKESRFQPPLSIEEVAAKASRFLSLGVMMGEGWLLAGEIAELLDAGVEHVVCVQPFGCLPNHVIGRGMFNAIKQAYPNASLLSVDFDPQISEVNQLNRIKLLLAAGRRPAAAGPDAAG